MGCRSCESSCVRGVGARLRTPKRNLLARVGHLHRLWLWRFANGRSSPSALVQDVSQSRAWAGKADIEELRQPCTIPLVHAKFTEEGVARLNARRGDSLFLLPRPVGGCGFFVETRQTGRADGAGRRFSRAGRRFRRIQRENRIQDPKPNPTQPGRIPLAPKILQIRTCNAKTTTAASTKPDYRTIAGFHAQKRG